MSCKVLYNCTGSLVLEWLSQTFQKVDAFYTCAVICFVVEQAFMVKVAHLRKKFGFFLKQQQQKSNPSRKHHRKTCRGRVKAICLKALCKTYTQCWGNKPIMCASQEVGD